MAKERVTPEIQKTILVAEDDPLISGLLQDVLKDAGFFVLTAMNGREALDRLSDVIPDLIISDCRMPVMDGDALFRAVKSDRRTRRIPYVVLTAEADRTIKKRLFDGFIDAFLIKPFDNRAVLDTVDRFLRTLRVLVAEPDEPICEMLKLALGRFGFRVSTAFDGQEALRRLSQGTFDLLFVEKELPVFDGQMLVRVLRGLDPAPNPQFERACAAGHELRILMSSGRDTFEELPEEIRASIDGFVAKPYDLSELGARIRLAVGRPPAA